VLSRMLITYGSMLLGFGTGQYNKGKPLPFFPWALLAALAVVIGYCEG
jgi:hypothetical protein